MFDAKHSALYPYKNRYAIFDYIRAFLCLKEKRGKRSKKACGFTALLVEAMGHI